MKYICLDIGNVICKVDFSNFNKLLSKTLNINLDQVMYFINRTAQLHDLGLTNIGDELRDHYKIQSSVIVDDLISEWNKVISLDNLILGWIKERLIKNNVQIALLSNIGFEHSSLIKHMLPSDIYDPAIKFFSCEVGARKPSLLYYKTFLDMYPQFRGAIYMDDRAENIATGKLFGLDAIQFELDKLTVSETVKKLTYIEKCLGL